MSFQPIASFLLIALSTGTDVKSDVISNETKLKHDQVFEWK